MRVGVLGICMGVAVLLSSCAEQIAVHGPILPAGAREVTERIAASTASTIVLDLDSNGGEVESGMAIVAAIERARGRTWIVTRVSDHCHSMCVAIFLAGDERLAAPEARFIVHGASDAAGNPRPEVTGGLLAYYLVRGVDPAWIAGRLAAGQAQPDDMLVVTGPQMARLISR